VRSIVRVLFLAAFCKLPNVAYSQYKLTSEMVKSTIQFKDGTTSVEQINPYSLFVKSQILAEKKSISVSSVDWIEIDSIKYFIRKVSNIREDTLKIVEAISIGTLSLYRSARHSEKSDILVEKNGIAYQLRVIRSAKWDSPKQIREVKEYLSILIGLTNDCPGVKSLKANTALEIRQIEKIIVEYNSRCGKQSFQNTRLEKKKNSFSLGVVGGYGFVSNEIVYGQIARRGNFSSSKPFFGMFIRSDFGRYSKFSFENELVYEQIKGQTFATTSPNSLFLLLEQIRYDISQLRNQLGFDYRFFDKKFNMNVGLGVSVKYQLQNNSAIDYYYGTSGGFSEAITNPSNLSFSPFLTLRGSAGRFDIRYRVVAFTANLPDFEDIAFEHRFSLMYTLFKNK
jgi:hypothetical protein